MNLQSICYVSGAAAITTTCTGRRRRRAIVDSGRRRKAIVHSGPEEFDPEALPLPSIASSTEEDVEEVKCLISHSLLLDTKAM